MADNLTDIQLIEELQRHGEKVTLPMTAKKRPILVKKLNHLNAREKAKNAPPKPTKKRRSTARASTGVDLFSSDDSDIEVRVKPEPQPALRPKMTSTPRSTRSQNALPTRGKSVTENKDINNSNMMENEPVLNHVASTSRLNTSKKQTTLPSIVTKSLIKGRRSGVLPKSPLMQSFDRNQTFDDFESSDSDIEGSSFEVENRSMNTTFTLGSPEVGKTSRIWSNTSSKAKYDEHNNAADNSFTEEQIIRQGFKTVDHKSAFRSQCLQHISMVVVCVVAIFFAILATVYLGMKSETSKMVIDNGVKDSNQLCEAGNKGKGCHFQTEALIVVKDLFDLLSKRAGDIECGYGPPEDKKNESVEIVNTIVRNRMPELTSNEERNDIYEKVLNLILLNPNWQIRCLDASGDVAVALSDIVSLQSSEAAMDLMCRIKKAINRVIFGLLITFLVLLVGGLCALFLMWRWRSQQAQQQKVYAMVERIIDILKTRYEENQQDKDTPAYLAVQHIRDQLLPPATRRKMQPIWDNAVQFIESNESRIRLETQTIEGEDFQVWRWLNSYPNGGKVWQGQAFGEHSENNANLRPYSPTQCLKVRNMFDADVEVDDSWRINVRDAILEKTRDIPEILHMHVDDTSREGCVYMKCTSCDAAGQIYKSLHGWWFDGRLVTVKYLWPGHYHNRFSEAEIAATALKPSNKNMASVSQPYHRSSLEMI